MGISIDIDKIEELIGKQIDGVIKTHLQKGVILFQTDGLQCDLVFLQVMMIGV